MAYLRNCLAAERVSTAVAVAAAAAAKTKARNSSIPVDDASKLLRASSGRRRVLLFHPLSNMSDIGL